MMGYAIRATETKLRRSPISNLRLINKSLFGRLSGVLKMIQLQSAGENHRLSTTVYFQLLENGRDMGLDRRLSDVQLIGYFLVELSGAQHFQDLELLSRQRRQSTRH